MIKIAGKYNTAKVFTDVLEDSCLEQIKALLDLELLAMLLCALCQIVMQVLAV